MVDGAVGVLLQGTPGGSPTLGSSSSHPKVRWAPRRGFPASSESGRLSLGCSSWKQGTCCEQVDPRRPAGTPVPPQLGAALCPLCSSAPYGPEMGHFQTLEQVPSPCGGTSKAVTLCMNQPRAFWMHQVNVM